MSDRITRRMNVINVDSIPAKDKNGKDYTKAEVTYKQDGDNKVQSKTIMPFGNTKDACLSLLSNGKGSFDVEMVKNDKGYWDWLKVSPATGGAPAASQSSSTTSAYIGSGQASGATQGRSFESAEERAEKQRYIVRQSSLSNAVEYFNVTGNKKVTVEDVIDLAAKFENFVFEGPGAVLANMPTPKSDDEFDDIKY